MKLFQRNHQEIKGEIGYFGLADWWLSSFTAEERTYIEDTYAPMGAGVGEGVAPQKGTLTKGNITFTTQTVGMFLSGLSTWFRKTEHDREVARRMLTKAVEVTDPNRDVFGLHFTYQALIEVWYRDRDTLPTALDQATEACLKQIALAPKAAQQFKKEYPKSPLPSHVGYTQLTIIYDKQGRYDEAIKIAKQAKAQGWNGDWDNRIERYDRKKRKPK